MALCPTLAPKQKKTGLAAGPFRLIRPAHVAQVVSTLFGCVVQLA